MALFSVIQQNTGTEMVRFLHLGDENLHLGNKTLHSAIKCDMIDLPKNVLKSTVIPGESISHFCAEKAPNIPITQKNIPTTQIGLTFCENSARIFTKDCAMMPAL